MSGTVIITKYSTATGSPATNALAVGEQAYSFNSDRLFIGETSGGDVVAKVIGGQLYTDMMDHTAGVLTASSAIITDSNNKIDHLIVDNLDFNLNHITSTNTNGNINITPNGSGNVVIDGLAHPTADGSNGQFLKTDGSGNLSFGTVVSSFTIAAESGTADVVNTGETLTFAAGEGIDTVVSANTITITGEDATTTNKGVASFNSGHFAVNSGAVTIAANGIDDTLIDWGTGSNQVSTDDVPEGSTNLFYTDERVDDRVSNLIVAGEGVDVTYNDGAGTFTLAGEDATTSNKGIASFATADFAVSSGAVTIKSAGVSNTQLVNDGITIGSDDTSLGGTITDLNGITSLDVDNITVDGNAISTTNSNGNLDLTPNGSGTVTVPSGYAGRAGFTSDSLANKSYVDSVANGLDVKASVRVATTANLATAYNNANGTLTASSNGAIAIDGISDLVVGNRILVKNQSTAAQNGFYKVTTVGNGSTAYVLTRTPDADAASELTAGAFTFAEEGTLNGDNGYVMSTNGAVTLGTTAITFEQFSGAGQITAGNGLTKNGNTINAVGTADKITVSADAVTIASTYAGQSSIVTLGTITSGTWAATDVAVAHGGTGSSTAAGAATNLGLGTGDSPMFTGVNVGHASDTTLARSSAGNLSIEGNLIYRAGGTDIPISDGGTGVSSHTGKAFWVSNAAGTAITYITGTQYQHLGFSSTGVPQASGTIDGGTF